MAGRIVVGVDDSLEAAAALRWAICEAELRDATLEVVHAWTFVPVTTPGDAGLVPVPWSENVEVLDASRRAAEDLASRVVAEVAGPTPAVELSVSVVEGPAADVLRAAATGADLVVVGNRGRGNLISAILGSVSSDLADEAPCPVVIVRNAA